MASEAEVDLIISTDQALPQLERDLTAIVRTAEANADEVELQALLDADDSLAELIRGLDAIIADAQLAADPIELEARLDQLASLTDLQDDLSEVIRAAEAAAQQIELEAGIDADIAQLDAEIAALVEELEASAPEVDIQVDVDRDGRGLRAASGLAKAIGTIPASMAGLGAAIGPAVQLLAAAAASLEAIAPASALAVSGMTTVVLAAGTVKLAMAGVGDAVKAAFDPKAKPEDLAKAMEKLAPNARAFVTELQSMKSGFTALQQDVQNRFFEGFADSLRSLSANVMPAVSKATRETASVLNQMARGAADAASKLGKDGTLGKALQGSVTGLNNMKNIPGQIVTGLGQIGAAAAPAFDRVTKAVSNVATQVSQRLTGAFESGRLEGAIQRAVDAIAQLGRIAGNIFSGLGNIIKTVSVEGNGLFSTLEKVSQAFKDVTATQGFQDALKALVQTGNVLVTTLLPLISQALQALGPVFTALAPPVQALIQALGTALQPVIAALGPVLVVVAQAFGQLVNFIKPLLDLASRLIAAILPALGPLFAAVGQTIAAMTPFVQQLANILAATLVPLFNTLATQVFPQLLPPLVQLSTAIFPVLTRILVGLAPALTKLAEVFGQVLVAATPLIVELINMTLAIGEKLMPLIEPLISLMLKLTTGALAILAAQITNVVIPAIHILVQLLQGDFSGAWNSAKELVRNVADKLAEFIENMKNRVVAKLQELSSQAVAKIQEMANNAIARFQDFVSRAAAKVGELPGLARSALGNLGGVLLSAGADLVQGFINGISSRLARLREIASEVASTVKNAVGDFLRIGSPSRLMREMGQDTAEGFRLGIGDGKSGVAAQLRSLAALAPNFGLPGGQGLAVASPTVAGPNVQVFLGNELLNGHIDTRIGRSNTARDRLIVRGSRR